MPINLEYSDCPKCGEPINDDKEAGDTCDDCGFQFPAIKPPDCPLCNEPILPEDKTATGGYDLVHKNCPDDSEGDTDLEETT